MEPISAILGLGGSFLGAMTQQDAAEKNFNINLLNYYARNQERQDRISAQNQATRERRDAANERKEGGIDAEGNRYHYVPGLGYVTDLSEQSQARQSLRNRMEQAQAKGDIERLKEQSTRLAVEEPLRRKRLFQDYAEQAQDRNMADTLRDQMGRADTPTASDLMPMLRTAIAAGISNDFDNAEKSVANDAIRQNSTMFGKFATDLATKRSKAIAQASAGVPIQAMQMAEQMRAGKQGQLANLYNMFANRASMKPNTQYTPSGTVSPGNPTGGASNLLSYFNSQRNSAQDAVGDSMDKEATAYGQKGGTLDYIEPNMGFANALASSGNYLGAMMGKGKSTSDFENFYESLKKRSGAGKSDGDF